MDLSNFSEGIELDDSYCEKEEALWGKRESQETNNAFQSKPEKRSKLLDDKKIRNCIFCRQECPYQKEKRRT